MGRDSLLGVSTGVRLAAKYAVRAASSSVIRRLGIDLTAEFPRESCLVIAPHPDDETLGCGATIARARSLGAEVAVVFVTGGTASPRAAGTSLAELVARRRAEAARALSILGVDRSAIVHLDFEDGGVSHAASDVADALTTVIRATGPGKVLVTSVADRHPDHVAVGRAARAAVSRCTVPPVLYEFAIWQRVPALAAVRDVARPRPAGIPPGRGPGSRPVVVRSDGFRETKRQAVAAYQSQLPHFPAGFVADFLLSYEAFTPVAASAARVSA